MNTKHSLGLVLLFSALLFVGTAGVSQSSNVNIDYQGTSADQLSVQSNLGSLILSFGELKLDTNNIQSKSDPVTVTLDVQNQQTGDTYSTQYEFNVDNSSDIPISENVIGQQKLASDGFNVSQSTTVEYQITVDHPDVDPRSITDKINISVVANPSTCSDILSNNPNANDGTYSVEQNNTQFDVYCVFNPSGDLVADSYTLKYVQNGKTTARLSDPNTCQEYGMQLFVPRSPAEYDVAKNYVANTYGKDPANWDSAMTGVGGGLGPMGLYYNDTFVGGEDSLDSSSSPFADKDVKSYHYGSNTIDGGENGNGWLTFLDTDRFWISGGVIDGGEPNGDYTPNTWLGFEWNSNGDVSDFNDVNNVGYEYDSYLCTQEYTEQLN